MVNRLVTADIGIQGEPQDADAYHAIIANQARRAGVARQLLGRPDDIDGEAAPAIAYINEGRWIADCPTDACTNAMVLLKGAPFLCSSCFNAEIGYRYRTVEWPAEAVAIEAVLLERPVAATRNWTSVARTGWLAVNETVEDLQRENRKHLGGGVEPIPHPDERVGRV